MADDDLWLGKFSHVTQIQPGCWRVRFYPSVIQWHVESLGTHAGHTCIKRSMGVIDYWDPSIDNLSAWPRDTAIASCHRWKLYHITEVNRIKLRNEVGLYYSIDIYENGWIKERSPIDIISWKSLSEKNCYEWIIDYYNVVNW